MAVSINIVFLIGNLGKDPELKYSQDGIPVARMSLATNECTKNGKDRVEWHNVVAFEKTAENCARYLKKGSSVHIEGSLRTRSWEAQSGEKRYITEVIARRVQFLDRGQRKESHEYTSGYDDLVQDEQIRFYYPYNCWRMFYIS